MTSPSFARRVRRALGLLVAVAAAGGWSCGGSAADDRAAVGGITPRARFAVPAALSALDGEHFFDHPWPSDMRREADGSVRLDGYVNPRESPLIKRYVEQMRGRLDGFSPAAAGYLSFTEAIDVASLPADARASTLADASLQLVDVDSSSPQVGQRTPIIWRYREKVGDYYTVPSTIAWMPVIGRPLRPKTRYAIIATRALKAKGGGAAAPNDALEALLAGQGRLAAPWGPALDALVKAGVSRDRIAHLSVFTTSDPVGEAIRAADATRALPPPTLASIDQGESNDVLDTYEGVYAGSPDFQKGVVPFKSEGGGFALGADGVPVKQRDFEVRFLLAVPNADKCPMPATGYPVVLYAHGTGGDYASFVRDGTADALASRCLASMGIDQIFHGVRPGAPPDGPDKVSQIQLLFFNVSNAIASRTNTRQAAIDEIARARFVASGGLVVPADVSFSGEEIELDPKKIAFFGHSQGGLNGPLLFALDDQTRGGVLSGAGSLISFSLLAKTSPEPSVAALMKVFLGIQGANEDELNELHPAISLVQTLIDPSDPIHYYAAIARAPFPGRIAKSVLMTEGVRADGTGDTAAPPRTIEAGAIAGAFPLLQPVVRDVPELSIVAGLTSLPAPVRGNAAAGKATTALAQFAPADGRDGHFVAFDVPEARTLTADFCASLLSDDVPSIGRR